MIRLTIPGKPLGKQRHQSTIRGRGDDAFIHEYTPYTTMSYETYVKVLFQQAFPKHLPFPPGAALVSVIRAYFPIPKSATKKKLEDIQNGLERFTSKPDGDNIEKIIWDALNQIAYAGDQQIVHWEGDKLYSDRPRVEIDLYTWTEWRLIRDL